MKVLDAKLNDITWSIFAGDLGIDIVTGLIPGGTKMETMRIKVPTGMDTAVTVSKIGGRVICRRLSSPKQKQHLL